MESSWNVRRKEDGTSLIKCSCKIYLTSQNITIHTGWEGVGVVPKGNPSYTVLCLLSQVYPIASEEWGGKSINIPSESESADSSTCPIMVSGLDDSLGGVEDAPLLRSVIVVVASVPWRAPEEWMGRMEGDERGKSMELAPPCTIPLN